MRFLSACVAMFAIACSGGSSSSNRDTTEPTPGPTMTRAEKQGATCKALCATMGRCSNADDWDASACQAACTKKPLPVKHLVAYDGCAANTECSALGPCMKTVKVAIRQDKTCNAVCDRNNTCAIESAKKNLSPEKAKQHTEEKILSRNRTECMAECMDKPKTAGQIKGADVCLAKTSCDEYTTCATGGSADDD